MTLLVLLLLASTYAVARGLDYAFPTPPLDCAHLTEIARLYVYPCRAVGP